MAASDIDNRRSVRFAFIALGLALLAGGAMLYYHQCLFLQRAHEVSAAKGLGGGYEFGNDFYPVWVTAREALRGHDPYSAEMTREIQVGLFGRALDSRLASDPKDLRMFVHPAFTLLVMWPAAELPFEAARVVMGVLLVTMTLGSILLWMKALSWQVRWPWLLVLVLLSVCSYPVLEGLYAEQLGLLMALLLAAAVVMLQRGRLLLAGVLIALTMMKPQMSVLVAFYILLWSLAGARRRVRFLLGFFSTMVLLIGAALLVWPHWIQSWVRVLSQYHQYSEPSLLGGMLISLLGARLAGPATVALTAGAIIIGLVMAWRNRGAAADSFTFVWTVSVLLAITVIAVLPGQAVYDHVILLPGILLVVQYWREMRALGRVPRLLLGMGAVVLFWPWVAALGLVVVRPVVESFTFNSPAVLALPIRTAASLPFAVIALLGYTTRVALAEIEATS